MEGGGRRVLFTMTLFPQIFYCEVLCRLCRGAWERVSAATEPNEVRVVVKIRKRSARTPWLFRYIRFFRKEKRDRRPGDPDRRGCRTAKGRGESYHRSFMSFRSSAPWQNVKQNTRASR
ncbi:MAG: hypothetical protein K0S58_1047 [Nitrospira sp.]|jgi:hypothetical protein|nr:hypothetical protein [Nitrospira sp.]